MLKINNSHWFGINIWTLSNDLCNLNSPKNIDKMKADAYA